jgi:hypothetical protein
MISNIFFINYNQLDDRGPIAPGFNVDNMALAIILCCIEPSSKSTEIEKKNRRKVGKIKKRKMPKVLRISGKNEHFFFREVKFNLIFIFFKIFKI